MPGTRAGGVWRSACLCLLAFLLTAPTCGDSDPPAPLTIINETDKSVTITVPSLQGYDYWETLAPGTQVRVGFPLSKRVVSDGVLCTKHTFAAEINAGSRNRQIIDTLDPPICSGDEWRITRG